MEGEEANVALVNTQFIDDGVGPGKQVAVHMDVNKPIGDGYKRHCNA